MSYAPDELVLWPLLPNWKQPVVEPLEFRTRVIGPTMTGLRQKRRMRIAPRRGLQFEVHPHHASRRLLDTLRFAQGKREWALPIWMDCQKVTAELAAASVSIPCETAGYDFAEGRYAVLRPNLISSREFEIVQIDSIDADAINLTGATVNTWPQGSYLFPVRMARMADDSNTASLLTDEVSTLSASFDISEPCDWDAYEFEDIYLGYPVWEFKTNWTQPRNFSTNRIITAVDNDTSVPSYFDFPDKTFAGLNSLWHAKTREQKSTMRGALYALLGRYQTLWVPTLANDLQMTGSIGSSSKNLVVEYCGYTVFGLLEGRRDIRIELNDGTVFYRRITASGETGGNEQLTLNASLGQSVSATNVRRISFMMLMQQASDSVSITHLTDLVATMPLVFEGVVAPPED